MPDFTIVQGQTIPTFADTLTYSNGSVAEPESVVFVMRSLTASEPLVLKGSATVTSKAKGEVSFAPNAADTATPGNYMANWEAQISGATMTFPTTGYLWVEVKENLASSTVQQIVGLPELKDHCNIKSDDRTHDSKLVRHIEAVGPLIENAIGPVRIKTYDEWYEGGDVMIGLRHKPTFGYGAEPVLHIMAVSEYRGPIEYNISIVGTPTQGSVYSEMTHEELGTIVRRTSGGGTYPWWSDPNHPQQSVHVVYSAGLASVPRPVQLAALETIRVAYENTMLVGKGFLTVADAQEPSMPLGFYFARHGLEMLQPYLRGPAFA